jgi:NADPH-dependent 2,4-dienoyl-CoA reductase/sulfur reductase-like enzyme
MHVVIVGASLAGTRTAQALRMKGFDGPVTLLGEETQLPYDRPPLSKEHLHPGPPVPPTPLLDEERLSALDLDLRLGTTAVGLDIGARQVQTATGERVPYDHVVLATGSRPRTWPLAGDLSGILMLRTAADADLLRAALDQRPRVAVLGGGFIGSEVAAAARQRGLDVTVIEMLAAPMAAGLGPRVGRLLGRLHAEAGVGLRCGTTVTQVRGSGRVEQLVLADGTALDTDLVVVGIGAVPAVEWLAGSGLDLANGVVCDETLRAVGADNVYAAGDIANWPHPRFGRLRVEHWTNAQEHASLVAGAILGEARPADAVPYVWSDQYGRRIQIVGRPHHSHAVTVIEDAETGRHVAVYEDGGQVSGLLTIDAPKLMLRGRRAIAAGQPAGDLIAALGLPAQALT